MNVQSLTRYLRNGGRVALAALLGALLAHGDGPGLRDARAGPRDMLVERREAPAVTPRTLVETSSRIEAFAQDGRDIAWITSEARSCRGGRLNIRPFGARRAVTIDRIDCSDSEQSGPAEELALANGRALWRLTTDFSNQAFGVSIRTASIADRRVVELPCCDLEYEAGVDPLPSWPLAGSRGILVYHSYGGQYDPLRKGTVMRVGGKGGARALFAADDPPDLAVDPERIALATLEVRKGEGCRCNFFPVWSPDGTRIAFLRFERPPYEDELGELGAEIAVMNANGTGLTTLTSDRRDRYALDWSSDGTRFVYTYMDGSESRIAVADADGGGSQDVATGWDPTSSPTGEAITFRRDNDLYVINLDSTGLRRLGPGEDPSWSPDGKRIAFVRYVRRRPVLFLVNANGSGLRRLGPGEDPSWSPDGKRIAFVRDFALFVMRADGTGARRLLGEEHDVYPSDPLWSPAGGRIAYFDAARLSVINTDGTGRRRLVSRRLTSPPAWAPDGRRLTFSLRVGGWEDQLLESEIHAVDLEGGNLRGLGFTTDEAFSAGEIRSARGAVLASFQSKGAPVAIAVSGSLATVLTDSGSKQVEVFDARTGVSNGLVRLPRATAPSLAMSERWLVFSVAKTISAIDLRTRKTRLLARAAGIPIGLSISGGRVAWAENVSGRGRVRTLLLPRY